MKAIGYLAVGAIFLCGSYLAQNKGTPEYQAAAQAMHQGR